MKKSVTFAAIEPLGRFEKKGSPNRLLDRIRSSSSRDVTVAPRLHGLSTVVRAQPPDVAAAAAKASGVFRTSAKTEPLELHRALIETIQSQTLNSRQVTARAAFLVSRLAPENFGAWARDTNHDTSLHHAVQRGMADLVRLLASKTKQLLPVNRHGETPLTLAAARGDASTIEILLANGVGMKAVDALSATLRQRVWFGAIRAGSAMLTEHLIGKVHDFSARDRDGNTALHYAAEHEMIKFVGQLAGKIDVNAPNNFGYTALIVAARVGSVDGVLALLEKGARLDGRDRVGRTALHHAAQEGHCDVVAALLDQHAAVTWPIVYAAASLARTQVVKILAERGADIYRADDKGDTLLTQAVKRGDRAMVDVLLEHNVPIDHGNDNRMTALLIAAVDGHLEIAEALLEHGADREATDVFGRTPLALAAMAGRRDLVDLLLKYEASADAVDVQGARPLSHAAINGRFEAAQALVAAGAPVNAFDRLGRTPLFVAALKGHDAIVELLIDNGADLDRPNQEKCTPLIAAAWFNRISVIHVLIRRGADVALGDSNGRTALQYAKKFQNVRAIEALRSWRFIFEGRGAAP